MEEQKASELFNFLYFSIYFPLCFLPVFLPSSIFTSLFLSSPQVLADMLQYRLSILYISLASSHPSLSYFRSYPFFVTLSPLLSGHLISLLPRSLPHSPFPLLSGQLIELPESPVRRHSTVEDDRRAATLERDPPTPAHDKEKKGHRSAWGMVGHLRPRWTNWGRGGPAGIKVGQVGGGTSGWWVEGYGGAWGGRYRQSRTVRERGAWGIKVRSCSYCFLGVCKPPLLA